MGTYSSSIGGQLGAFERNVKGFVRKTLLAGGRRFRSTMNRERLSGPPGVYKVSGKLKRSFRYTVEIGNGSGSLDAQIGGGAAPYAQDHEEQHRIEFKNTFEREARTMLDEISAAMQFFARNPVESGGAEPIQGNITEGNDDGGGERGQLLGQLASHFAARKAAAKIRRQSQWRSIVRGA